MTVRSTDEESHDIVQIGIIDFERDVTGERRGEASAGVSIFRLTLRGIKNILNPFLNSVLIPFGESS